MNAYQTEQLETLDMVRRHLATLSEAEREVLHAMIADYLAFREGIAAFLADHFGAICTRNCYESKLSACCSKDGIITFFADVVINALVSQPDELEMLSTVLRRPNTGFKCVYLGDRGCLWRIKPIVCEMFLCDSAKEEAFEQDPASVRIWKAFGDRKKQYTWPDRPVLFDALERHFIDAGYQSSLMYLHNSPGLVRVKQKAIEKGIYHHERQ